MKKLTILALTLATSALLALSAASNGEAATPCYAHACNVHLVATTGRVHHWSSQRFSTSSRPQLDYVLVQFYRRGRQIAQGDINSCRSVLYGQHVLIKLSTCGDPTRLRLGFRSLGRGPRHFRFHYRAMGG